MFPPTSTTDLGNITYYRVLVNNQTTRSLGIGAGDIVARVPNAGNVHAIQLAYGRGGDLTHRLAQPDGTLTSLDTELAALVADGTLEELQAVP